MLRALANAVGGVVVLAGNVGPAQQTAPAQPRQHQAGDDHRQHPTTRAPSGRRRRQHQAEPDDGHPGLQVQVPQPAHREPPVPEARITQPRLPRRTELGRVARRRIHADRPNQVVLHRLPPAEQRQQAHHGQRQGRPPDHPPARRGPEEHGRQRPRQVQADVGTLPGQDGQPDTGPAQGDRHGQADRHHPAEKPHPPGSRRWHRRGVAPGTGRIRGATLIRVNGSRMSHNARDGDPEVSPPQE